MPFTANKAFRGTPRIVDRAQGMWLYTEGDQKPILGEFQVSDPCTTARNGWLVEIPLSPTITTTSVCIVMRTAQTLLPVSGVVSADCETDQL